MGLVCHERLVNAKGWKRKYGEVLGLLPAEVFLLCFCFNFNTENLGGKKILFK